jgi:hypothetical protein
LGEAVACREIGANDFDVALSDDVADVALRTIFHTLSLYAARNAIFTGYPRFGEAFRVISSRTQLSTRSA